MADPRSANGSEATSQAHGRAFENLIRDCGRFPAAVGTRSPGSSANDVEAHLDLELALHTSVKTTCGGTIGLADAIRFHENDRAFRMILAVCEQTDPETKSVTSITELIVTTATLARLKGRMPLALVRAMHAEYASFPPGPDGRRAARLAADRMIRAHGHLLPLTRLDFKGDDRSQRRLQLTIGVRTLLNAVADDPEYVQGARSVRTTLRETRLYHGLVLPLAIASPARRFRDPDAADQPDMALRPPTTPPRSSAIRPRTTRRVDDAARVAAASDAAQPRLLA